jgi:hypothetical protein
MNTRIQELIIQANFLFLRKDEKSIEKFAELIVKECVECLWTQECYTSDLALEQFKKNSNKIKQHFGVAQ